MADRYPDADILPSVEPAKETVATMDEIRDAGRQAEARCLCRPLRARAASRRIGPASGFVRAGRSVLRDAALRATPLGRVLWGLQKNLDFGLSAWKAAILGRLLLLIRLPPTLLRFPPALPQVLLAWIRLGTCRRFHCARPRLMSWRMAQASPGGSGAVDSFRAQRVEAGRRPIGREVMTRPAESATLRSPVRAHFSRLHQAERSTPKSGVTSGRPSLLE